LTGFQRSISKIYKEQQIREKSKRKKFIFYSTVILTLSNKASSWTLVRPAAGAGAKALTTAKEVKSKAKDFMLFVCLFV
jgi:hypothetical protein